MKKILEKMFDCEEYLRLSDLKDQLNQTYECKHVSFVNQESDGKILIYWTVIEDYGTVSTHFGVYDPESRHESQSIRELFYIRDELHITSMTLNTDHQILGFVQYEFDEYTGKDVFKTYLTELYPSEGSRNLTDINCISREFVKIQSLHSHRSNAIGMESTYSMLILRHLDGINLLTIRTKSAHHNSDRYNCKIRGYETNAIVTPEVDADGGHSGLNRFFWAQWEIKNQRLFYTVFLKDGLHLIALNFLSLSHYEKTLDILLIAGFNNSNSLAPNKNNLLGLNFNLTNCVNIEPRYEFLPFADTISDRHINMRIHTQKAGTLYICAQSITGGPFTTPSSDLSYTILPVHHLHSFQCTAHDAVFRTTLLPMESDLQRVQYSYGLHRIHFTVFDNFIMALLPKRFIHMFDLGHQHEPCHHIYLEEDRLQMLKKEVDYLATFNYIPTARPVTFFVEPRTQIIYKLLINEKSFINYVFSPMDSEKRMALIHLATVHLGVMFGTNASEKIIKLMCDDINNLEATSILTEFIIASTYKACIQNKMPNKAGLLILPYTSSQDDSKKVSGLKIVKRENSSKFFITIKSVQQLKIAEFFKRPTKKSRSLHAHDDTWERLIQQIQYSLMLYGGTSLESSTKGNSTRITTSPRNTRLDLFDHDLQNELEGALKEDSSKSKKKRPIFATSIIRRNNITIDLSRWEMSENIQFLNNIQTVEPYVSVISKRLTKVVDGNTYLMQKKISIDALAILYCQLMMVQSVKVLDIAWSTMEFTKENKPQQSPLNKRATNHEKLYFEFLEKFFIVADKMFMPFPPEVVDVFVILGYKSLPFYSFMHYIDSGIFHFTKKFSEKALKELPDDDVGFALKLEILSRNEINTMFNMSQHWNSNFIKNYELEYHTANLLQNEMLGSSSAVKFDERPSKEEQTNANQNGDLINTAAKCLKSFVLDLGSIKNSNNKRLLHILKDDNFKYDQYFTIGEST